MKAMAMVTAKTAMMAMTAMMVLVKN